MPMITVAKRQLAIGGEWKLPGNRGEASEIIRAHKSGLMIDYRAGIERALGIYADIRNTSAKAYSGVLACAQILPDAVIAERVGDSFVWVAGISEGIPMANYDCVCSATQARQTLTDILSIRNGAKVVGNFDVSAKHSLEEVLDQLTPNQWRAVRLMKPRKSHLIRIAVTACAIAVAGVVSWFAFDIVQTQWLSASKADAARRSKLSTEEGRRQLAEWEARVKEEVAKQRKEFSLGISPADAFQAVHARLMATAPLQQGWELARMNCTLKNQQCDLAWRSWEKYGTPEAAGKLDGAPKDFAGLLRTEVVAIGTVEVNRKDRGSVTSAALPAIASLGKFVEDCQLTVESAIKEERTTMPPPPQGLPQAKPEVLGKTVGWKATVPFHLAKGFSEKLSGVGVHTTSIEVVDVVKEPKVTLTGTIHISSD